MTTPRTYGLVVQPGKFADSKAVYVRVLSRVFGEDCPCNPRSEGEDSLWDAPKNTHGLALYQLEIVCWLTEDRKHLIGPEIRYGEVRFIDVKLARRMALTLGRIEMRLRKDKATEAGDVLVSVAKAIGATWHGYTLDKHPDRGTFYRDSAWHFGDIASARDQFRAEMKKISTLAEVA